MNKDEIRKKMLTFLKNIYPEVREQESQIITQRVLKLIPKNIRCISIFNSYKWEVNTLYLKNFFEKAGVTICYPQIIDKKAGIMQMVDQNNKVVNKSEIDIIFIPCIAFFQNNRLGWGKGFYDRYLEDFSGLKYLLAFDSQEHQFAVDKHDVEIIKV